MIKEIIQKVVNCQDNEIQFLDYIFEDSSTGAVGTLFNAISKEEYEYRTSKENITDYLNDIGYFEEEIFETEEEKEEHINSIIEKYGAENIIFDLSDSEHWNKLREELPQFSDEEKYPIFEWVGGGRMFDKDFQGNINPELSEKIRIVENLKNKYND